MSEEEGAKQSELAELSKVINELRESVKGKEKKPWVYTEARRANYEKANAKRIAAAEKKRVEAAIKEAERKAFEDERRAFYEMALKNPTGQTISKAPELVVSASAPNKTPTMPQSIPNSVEAEKKEVKFVEKPIMPDEIESVAHEHDHDDGWMTRAGNARESAAPPSSSSAQDMEAEEENIPPPAPLRRQTNAPAVAADWAEQQMERMASRKRAWEAQQEMEREQTFHAQATYRIGTGAGNHAPFEGDVGYVDARTSRALPQHNRHMVSPEEALQLLSMPKDVALRYLAERMSAQPQERQRLLRPAQDREYEEEPEDVAEGYLTHTQHYSTRHPSQLHSSTHSHRYHPHHAAGEQFLWL